MKIDDKYGRFGWVRSDVQKPFPFKKVRLHLTGMSTKDGFYARWNPFTRKFVGKNIVTKADKSIHWTYNF